MDPGQPTDINEDRTPGHQLAPAWPLQGRNPMAANTPALDKPQQSYSSHARTAHGGAMVKVSEIPSLRAEATWK